LFPKYSEIQIPLLNEIKSRGGTAKPSERDSQGKTVYEALADYFNLTPEARIDTISTTDSRIKWKNMIQWSRNDLKKKDLISNKERGTWSITSDAEKLLEYINNEKIGRGDFNDKYIVGLDKFKKMQERFLKIGEDGEAFVLNYEKKKLIELGKIELVEEIKQISVENVAAGYDILSFDANGNQIHIEVKSTTTNILEFELTRNELKKSREFGVSYWIYRVLNLYTDSPEIIKFQNPYRLIEEDKLHIIPTSWRVTIRED
jgi:hypothetical protein